MPYQLAIDGCLAERLGPDGLGLEEVARLAAELDHATGELGEALAAGRLRPLAVAREDADLASLEDEARRIAGAASDVLLLGIGGSSLAAQTLAALAVPGRGIRLHVVDNIDPATWRATLDRLDPATTHVLAVSKSGGTAETLAQALLARDWLAGAGRPPAEQMTVVTEPGARPLRGLAEADGMAVLDHDPEVGGRFSALTVVGLLPALLVGLDAAAVRRGAAATLDELGAEGAASTPARAALAAVGHERRGIRVQVMLPYADRLQPLARWWAQLWGESLGKEGRGSTPVAARGATDQHSQLQLWREGSRQHMVTVIAAPAGADSPALAAGRAGLGWLDGATLGRLFEAERDATGESLVAAGVPVRRLELDRIDEAGLGALLAHFMVETLLVARLAGTDAFGQPAVEDAKRRTRVKLAEAAR